MFNLAHLNLALDTEIPAGIKTWLYLEVPLTDRLKQISGDARLTLLSQGWVCASWWDLYVVDIDEPVFQREIFMSSHQETLWYARSIIPQSCFNSDPIFFKRLEQESIRNLIYSEPKVSLTKRLVYKIDVHCIEFHWVAKYLNTKEKAFWVRLSEFAYHNKMPFYLVEVLFPKLGTFQT